MSEITSIILAAGLGKRMRSPLPKIMHPVCGVPMIDYAVALAKELGSKKILVVAPPSKKEDVVQKHLQSLSPVEIVEQPTPLGTGHAVLQCFSSLNGFRGYVLILYGDNPLVNSKTIRPFLDEVQKREATLGLITTETDHPKGYGRIVRDASGRIAKIVEEKEASQKERALREVNTGVYCADLFWLFKTLKKLKRHPVSKEYYLTDIVDAAVREREKVVDFFSERSEEFLGINTPEELSLANERMRQKWVRYWFEKGVSFLDPRQVYLEATVQIGEKTLIYPQVYLEGKTRIGKNCIIECGCVLRDMIVADQSHVKPYCVLEGSLIEKKAQIGPFARIRPGSRVGKNSSIGNFVELKKARLARGVKANHLTYLGDCEIGSETNVGCGTITCNYDGVKKHPTLIGKGVFVGSDVQFVAPVKIGSNSYIGAGSTITEDVPSGALAIARSRQVIKRGWVEKRRKKQEAKSKK